MYSQLEVTWVAGKVCHGGASFWKTTNSENKDGYTSLLIEEEGGVAKEIVSEENGVLISTILRQYFMSLKVLGRWKRMGKSMNTKFTSIQTNLANKHTFHDASPTSPTTAGPPQPPSVDRVVRDTAHQTSGEQSDPDADEDEDDGPMYDDSIPIRFDERQKEVVRKVMRKWWRLAGLKHNPNACDELGTKEFQVNWTKAIAPRLEGRIREVGGVVKA